MNPFKVVVISGMTSGVIDILTTIAITLAQGMPPKKLLQFIASGALGERSFEGGAGAAWAGLGMHFAIALVVSAAYLLLSLNSGAILHHPVVSGLVFGAVVQLVMGLAVVPLSRTPPTPFTVSGFLTQLLVNAVCVGLVNAFVQARLLSAA